MSENRLLYTLISLVVALLMTAGGLCFAIHTKLSRQHPDPVPQPDTSQVEEEADAAILSGVERIEDKNGGDWGDAGVATHVNGVANILLVGQDTRGDTRERSDSMILVSVNKKSKQLTMVSLMRDLYVPIEGHGMQKLNAAYAFGGFDLLDQTIEDNFGVAIDYNVEVDFAGFKAIVDAIDGVDIELRQKEADYINGGTGNNRLTEGMNHLTGEEALWYARTRQVGNSDWERTQRQRILVKTIYEKAKKSDWKTLWDLYQSVSDCIETDMSTMQIMGMGLSVWQMDVDELNSYRIPADGMAHDETSSSGSVLVPNDWEETRQLLKDYIYSDDGGASAFEAISARYAQNYE